VYLPFVWAASAMTNESCLLKISMEIYFSCVRHKFKDPEAKPRVTLNAKQLFEKLHTQK
jgi:hypothetical protein